MRSEHALQRERHRAARRQREHTLDEGQRPHGRGLVAGRGLRRARLDDDVVAHEGDQSGHTAEDAAVIYGAVLGGMAGMVSLVASYVVVEADGAEPPHGDQRPPVWALALVAGVLPLAACGPVALALQSVL